jgi:hypothetical protein
MSKESRAGSCSSAGRAETFSTRTSWRRSVPKQQRHPVGNLLRTVGPVSRSAWTKALSGTGSELPWKVCIPPWSPSDSHHSQQTPHLSSHDHQWKTCKEKVTNKENLLGPSSSSQRTQGTGHSVAGPPSESCTWNPIRGWKTSEQNPKTLCLVQTIVCKLWKF